MFGEYRAMATGGKRGEDADGDVQLATREDVRPRQPPLYHVVLLNDDFTPMEFVVWLLAQVFRMSDDAATRLMLTIHTEGRGVAGTFTYDIAETKSAQVRALAERHGHPLQSVLEPSVGED